MSYHPPALALEGAHIYAGEKLLLPEVDLAVERGEHLVIRGESGSGKSTLLKVLCGFPLPATGRLLLDGEPMTPALRGTLRSEIAYVPQQPRLPADSAVMEYLRTPLAYRANRATRVSDREIEAVAEELRLSASLLLQRTSQLSGGEAHRVMVARAILLSRRLFILDEVSASLDPRSRAALLAALAIRSATVVSVSHDARWCSCADRVCELRSARLWWVGDSA